jgi:cellulose biosynthesis protein BcsQ
MYKVFLILRTDNEAVKDFFKNLFKETLVLININKNDDLKSLLECFIKTVILDSSCEDYKKLYDFFTKSGVCVISIGNDKDIKWPFDEDEILSKIEKTKVYFPEKKSSFNLKFNNFKDFLFKNYKRKKETDKEIIKKSKKHHFNKKSSEDYLDELKGLSLLEDDEIKILNKKEEDKKYFNFDNTCLKNKKVISFISTKGGSGKTTLILNIAKKLENQKNKVILIDLERQLGSSDISIFLNTPILPNIENYLIEPTEEVLKKSILKPEGSNFYVLQSSTKIDSFNENIYCKIIDYAKDSFGTVLINLPLIYSPFIKDVIKKSDVIVLIVTPLLGSLSRMKTFSEKVLSDFESLKRIVFYNKYKGEFKPSEIMSVIKADFLVLMPFDNNLEKNYQKQVFESSESILNKSINELITKIWDIKYLNLLS